MVQAGLFFFVFKIEFCQHHGLAETMPYLLLVLLKLYLADIFSIECDLLEGGGHFMFVIVSPVPNQSVWYII